jgi:hypothetical protein
MTDRYWYDPPILFPLILVVLLVAYALMRPAV